MASDKLIYIVPSDDNDLYSSLNASTQAASYNGIILNFDEDKTQDDYIQDYQDIVIDTIYDISSGILVDANSAGLGIGPNATNGIPLDDRDTNYHPVHGLQPLEGSIGFSQINLDGSNLDERI